MANHAEQDVLFEKVLKILGVSLYLQKKRDIFNRKFLLTRRKTIAFFICP